MQCRLDLNAARALDCIKSMSSQYGIHAGFTVLHQIWEDRWHQVWLKASCYHVYSPLLISKLEHGELILISSIWVMSVTFGLVKRFTLSSKLQPQCVFLHKLCYLVFVLWCVSMYHLKKYRGWLECISWLSCTCVKHFKQNSKCQPLTKRRNWPLKA